MTDPVGSARLPSADATDATPQGAPQPTPHPPAGSLPYGLVWVLAFGAFLLANGDKLGQPGGFIVVVGGVVLATISAGWMTTR
jgi:hypothetical protein